MKQQTTNSLLTGILVCLSAVGIWYLFGRFAGAWSGGRGMWAHHPTFLQGHGMGGGVAMIFFWLILIIAVVFLISGIFGSSDNTGKREPPVKPAPDALEILRRRYAAGEIDRTEFMDKRQDLLG